MLNEIDFELIDKFIQNRLNEKETIEFNSRLNDKEFFDELEVMKEIKNASFSSGRLRLKENLDKIFSSRIKPETNIISFIGFFKYPIAACLIITISISFLFASQKTPRKNIYFSHAGGASLIHHSNDIVEN